MESLSETKWDVLISGTGLKNSLLALALSRSGKKILHVDENAYYGGAEAAFSLQEVDEWVEKVGGDNPTKPFRNASLCKADADDLSFSRAYTLALSPQIIHTRSKLIAQLVSSKVYRQLEFQAVGNWWIYDGEAEVPLRKLPNGREDISQDKSIENRAKRSLMRFLKFVVDYENQTEMWDPCADKGLAGFLSSQFQLSPSLQSVITALTLSFDPPDQVPVKWALPRIARHLTSVGVFGPGFGAVVPKWGGGAEIAQVACRAGAVGGGVYVLGTGIKGSETVAEDSVQLTQVELSNGETVKTRLLFCDPESQKLTNREVVSKSIVIVSSTLISLFKSSIEGSPLAAVSVVVFPSSSLPTHAQPNPVYIMVHSSETGECPAGQSVLYASTLHSKDSKTVLEAAVAALLKSTDNDDSKPLYNLYYEQQQQLSTTESATPSDASLDLAFNDEILDAVEAQWKTIMTDQNGVLEGQFMQFEDREGMNNDDEDDEGF